MRPAATSRAMDARLRASSRHSSRRSISKAAVAGAGAGGMGEHGHGISSLGGPEREQFARGPHQDRERRTTQLLSASSEMAHLPALRHISAILFFRHVTVWVFRHPAHTNVRWDN
jgi:hypothetical protein